MRPSATYTFGKSLAIHYNTIDYQLAGSGDGFDDLPKLFDVFALALVNNSLAIDRRDDFHFNFSQICVAFSDSIVTFSLLS